MEYQKALEIAEHHVEIFSPYCERIAIAGSLRRKKAEVKDIEIVLQPMWKPRHDLFGMLLREDNALEPVFAVMRESGKGNFLKDGDRYKQIQLMTPGMDGVKLDIFMVAAPAQWGVILMLRTGPASFSRKVVTQRFKGGLLPNNMQVMSGFVTDDGGTSYMVMPEEEDYFRILGIDPIPPEERQ